MNFKHIILNACLFSRSIMHKFTKFCDLNKQLVAIAQLNPRFEVKLIIIILMEKKNSSDTEAVRYEIDHSMLLISKLKVVTDLKLANVKIMVVITDSIRFFPVDLELKESLLR